MTLWDRFLNTLKGVLVSRKFWVLLASLVTVATGYFTGEISAWQAIQAVVAALMAYAATVSVEDGLSKGLARRG